jgi:glutaminase
VISLDYKAILETIYDKLSTEFGKGVVASYIPELGKINPNQLGISICTNGGDEYTIGSAEKSFSIQSISKIFALALAYRLEGEKLWGRMGLEPSGMRFDSLILLEKEDGIPRNPFINAGALVTADILLKHFKHPSQEILKFASDLSGNETITINADVKESEIACAHRNYAQAYYMKSHNNINADIDILINSYSAQCAIEMSCVDLARAFRLFTTNGKDPWSQKQILTTQQNKRLNAIMMTCGLYNAVGDFAYRVGIPAKSGVGGGIVGVIPGEMSIAVWSPALDEAGNSLLGIKALEMFTTITGKSIY